MGTPAFSKIVVDPVFFSSSDSTRVVNVKSTGAVPAGSLVVVAISARSNTTISQVSDNTGVNPSYTVYQQTASTTSPYTGYTALAYLRLSQGLTSSNTISVAFSGTTIVGIAAVAFTDLSDQRVGQNTARALTQNQTVSVTPTQGSSGYLIGLTAMGIGYVNRPTGPVTGTTRLLGINPEGVTTWSPEAFATVNNSAFQFEVYWRPAKVTTTAIAGVDYSPSNDAAAAYNAVGIILPEASSWSSYPQVITMF